MSDENKVERLGRLIDANSKSYHAQRRELDAVSESLAAVRQERDLWEAEANRMRSERDAALADAKKWERLCEKDTSVDLAEHHEESINRIADALGDESEWTNACDRGEVALDLVNLLKAQLAALSAELDQAHQTGAALAVKAMKSEAAIRSALSIEPAVSEDRCTAVSSAHERDRLSWTALDAVPALIGAARQLHEVRAKLVSVANDTEAQPRETSASIAAWQTETFGPAITTTTERINRSYRAIQEAMWHVLNADRSIPRQNLSRACRAAEELAELIEVLVQRDDDPAACLEVADVQIVLAGIAAAHGKEQADLVTEKMKTNRARRWNTTGDGHGQHVDDGGDQ